MLPTQQGFDESFGYSDHEKATQKGSDIAHARHAHDDRVVAHQAADFTHWAAKASRRRR